MKKALITGITGQDGSYLAELLLEKNYIVHGLVRSTSSYAHISHLYNDESLRTRLFFHQGNLSDSSSMEQILAHVQPDEIYNLAATSCMQRFADQPEPMANIAALGTLRLLETTRKFCPHARIYQATSSELFGHAKEVPQTELTSFNPRSLYGIAKLYTYWAIVHYRENHQLFACNGILFNHESPRRNETFVSRKIIMAIARIHKGLQDKLVLGNLDAKRDWGYAKDFVEGMWKILQHSAPEDFVLATGEATTVRKFVEIAFKEIGMTIAWEGHGIHEKGIDQATGNIVVEVSPEFFRPAETVALIGNANKAKEKLGWVHKTSLEDLVHIMMQADKERIKNLF